MRSPTQRSTFDVTAFLQSPGIARRIGEYRRGDVIFTQGDRSDHVLYIQKGSVKLSVLSMMGREAVVAMLGPGEFLGEGCLAGQTIRKRTATAITDCTVLSVERAEMVRVLHQHPGLTDRFIAHVLARNIRSEEDLLDQLLNSSEKRLARTLLVLARNGQDDGPQGTVLKLTQETLAGMVGTTRSRVNFFMKKFQRLGFIEYCDGIKVNDSLATMVQCE
jgi:CRP/FNR family transcriptional regulator, cyclic AMP receptor protein